MNDIEIREIEAQSPIDGLKIGDDYFYSGTYIHGYSEGTSRIARFYKEAIFVDGAISPTDAASYWMELENGKLILLGMSKRGDFKLASSFSKNKPKH